MRYVWETGKHKRDNLFTMQQILSLKKWTSIFFLKCCPFTNTFALSMGERSPGHDTQDANIIDVLKTTLQYEFVLVT